MREEDLPAQTLGFGLKKGVGLLTDAKRCRQVSNTSFFRRFQLNTVLEKDTGLSG